jgi:hypothetical protein
LAAGLLEGVCSPNISLAIVAVCRLLIFPVFCGIEVLESLESKRILSLE